MAKRTTCVALLIICLLSSCEVAKVASDNWRLPDLNLPEVTFDPKFAKISLDGFRIQMSARMAKQVAAERGYKIDSSLSDITFDDAINSITRESSFNPDIYLKRNDEAILLSFDYGKVEGVKHEHMFYQRQQAEELLESYLKRYPELKLSNETENYKSYSYKSNRFNILAITIRKFGQNIHRVSIAVRDSNYGMQKNNQEIRQEYNDKIEVIRRGY